LLALIFHQARDDVNLFESSSFTSFKKCFRGDLRVLREAGGSAFLLHEPINQLVIE
jgi:hypothetical protein